jgi:hypothetical protein
MIRYISYHIHSPQAEGYEKEPKFQAAFFLLSEFPPLALLLAAALVPWFVKLGSPLHRLGLLTVLSLLASIAAFGKSIMSFAQRDPVLCAYAMELEWPCLAPIAWAVCGTLGVVTVVVALVSLVIKWWRERSP